MTTTADLVLDHVRRHGRIADLAALARAAGRAPRSVLKALSDLKTRGRVTYVLWDMPIRVVGEPVVHRDIKPANEVEKGDVEAVGPDVVQAAEAPNTVAKGDMDDAAEQPAEVVHRAPRRRHGIRSALVAHLRAHPGVRPAPAAVGLEHERDLSITLAHLRKRGVLTYPKTVGGRGNRLDWSTIKLLEEVPGSEPAEESPTAPGAPSPRSERGGERARAGRSPAPGAHHEPSDNPAAPGASSRPLAAEAFHVVDRRKRRLRGFAHIEDACRSQHKDLPHGYGVVRVSDGKWMSRLMPAGWGQPKADEEQEDLDDG